MEKVILHSTNEDDLVNKIALKVFELLKSSNAKEEVNDSNEEEYLTSTQVIELLKISPVTLWKWKKKGSINEYGIGGKRYFKKSEIDKFLIKVN